MPGFVQPADIEPVNSGFTVTVELDSNYSLSTTTGQPTDSFDNLPVPKSLPFPHLE